MTRALIITCATFLATLAAPAFAESVSFKPLQGVSFSSNAEHAVGYFTNKDGRCNVVVTRAGEPHWADNSLSVSRFEAKLAAGKTARYDRVTEFTCAIDANSLLMKRGAEVAASAEK